MGVRDGTINNVTCFTRIKGENGRVPTMRTLVGERKDGNITGRDIS